MAYVPGKTFDVFVSYAHADNAAFDDATISHDRRRGWVTQFVIDLRRVLKIRLGGSEELQIFHDVRHAERGSYWTEQLKHDVESSALMVSVLSPSYVEEHLPGNKPFTMIELEAFIRNPARVKDTLFGVQYLPFYSADTIPPMIKGLIAKKFWYESSEGSVAMPFTHREHNEYEQRIHDLAQALSERLRFMRAAGGGTTSGPGQRPRGTEGTILLAEVTEDLEEEREQVRRHLEQFGIRILPESDYPPGCADFEAAFATDLVNSELVIQLLSKVRGRRRPDVPMGYTRLQADLARESGKLLQWRHPEINVASITDADQRQLLDGPNVFAAGLEAFKEEVLLQLKARREQPKRKRGQSNRDEFEGISDGVAVFINAECNDLKQAKQLATLVSQNGHWAHLPETEGTTEEIRSDLEEHLLTCDALVLVYGRASPRWVRLQLNQYHRARRQRGGRPLRLMGLFIEPAGERADIGVEMPPDVIKFDLSCVDQMLGRLH